jgi:hypothetical protein
MNRIHNKLGYRDANGVVKYYPKSYIDGSSYWQNADTASSPKLYVTNEYFVVLTVGEYNISEELRAELLHAIAQEETQLTPPAIDEPKLENLSYLDVKQAIFEHEQAKQTQYWNGVLENAVAPVNTPNPTAEEPLQSVDEESVLTGDPEVVAGTNVAEETPENEEPLFPLNEKEGENAADIGSKPSPETLTATKKPSRTSKK